MCGGFAAGAIVNAAMVGIVILVAVIVARLTVSGVRLRVPRVGGLGQG
jgi:hypothetical protein